ncbi:MAG: alanine dehydrogenase [Treponema sp.]|jgi:alanine dehydrogenase|nr:alanine dehydrogenase [Treponema sp.]
MKIGCPKEIKNNEFRVGLTPNAVQAYVSAGHSVCIEKGAGLGSAITDDEYKAAGAAIVDTADEVWDDSEMLIKVKEPLKPEYDLMRENQLVYTYFHFAADKPLLDACLKRNIIAMAYETVQEGSGLPLLKPMSEVAGRMASLMGGFYSAKTQGGRGLLPMGVTGVAPANIVILGGGTVGANAAWTAAGFGAHVTILDINLQRLEYLGEILPPNVKAIYNDQMTMETYLKDADIVIGAILIPGAKSPKLIRREHLKMMKSGAVLVDVAIDQGGCFETSHPTSHADPVFTVDGIIHYCVANMPGAYARTSTYALNNATIRYGLQLANKGAEKACRENSALLSGLNAYKGEVTFPGVAEAFGLPLKNAADVIN